MWRPAMSTATVDMGDMPIDNPPISSSTAPRVTLTGGARAMPISTMALAAHEKMTIGRRRLPRKRSEMIPETGGAIRYPKGSSMVSSMVDSMDNPPSSK